MLNKQRDEISSLEYQIRQKDALNNELRNQARTHEENAIKLREEAAKSI